MSDRTRREGDRRIVRAGPPGPPVATAPRRSPWSERRLPPGRDLLIAALLFAAGVGPLLFFKFRSGFIPGDLDIYRTAGILALHGTAPYGAHFGHGLRVDLPFTYPPFAAFAVIPLGLQPARMAQVTWTAANLAMLGVMVWWLIRPALEKWGLDHPGYTAVAVVAFAWTIPMSQTIAYGQVNIFLALICLIDCTRLTRHRGVLCGIAAAIKLTPGLFVVYFAVTKQWAAALRSAVAFAVCEGLAAAVLPSGSSEYWFHLLWQLNRPGNPKKFFNQSINGLIYHLNWPHWLWFPGVAVVAAAGLWRAAKAHRTGCEVAAVALVGLSAVLISPISWQHHAVWIIMMFGAVAAWATTPRRRVVRERRPAIGGTQRERSWKRSGLVALLLIAFIAPVPQIGSLMINAHAATPIDYILENSDIWVFIAMLFVLPLVPVTLQERAPAPVPAVATTG